MPELFPSLVAAGAAAVGTLFGGLTSFATSYMVQQRHGHTERILREVERREDLYAQFNELAAKESLYALEHELEEPERLVGLATLVGRIRLGSTPLVLEAAEKVLSDIVTMYSSPPIDAADLIRKEPRKFVDPLVTFTKACRKERLAMLRGL